ncbi:hypothetical protein [Alicyclobacillus contaminans]|uniref:hypothetical protein n=1 Tax=Alicyclobacillus contaminans TaxID=392016 RepID=UPI0012EC5982|nr:hypothetical protein [Alicyclobacillus contaminans]
MEAIQDLQALAQTLAGNVVHTVTAAKETVDETTAVVPQTTSTAPVAQQSTPTPPASPVPTTPSPAAPAAPAVPTAPAAPAPVTSPGEAPQPAATPTPAPSAVPTAAPSYTLEQLAVAATQLVDAGRRTELVNLLSSFGVQALTELPKEQYGAFATKLREMGAKL